MIWAYAVVGLHEPGAGVADPGYNRNLHLPLGPNLRNLCGMLRSLAFIGILLGFAATGVSAADVEFIRVWPGWRDAQSFERIGEYFGRPEKSHHETLLRSQPSERGGYYFLVRVKTAVPVPDAKFELSVIRPDSPEAKVYTFATPSGLPAKETVFDLGLTGADWPQGKAAHPVAWKIALCNASGEVLAEHKSFLWEKPAK